MPNLRHLPDGWVVKEPLHLCVIEESDSAYAFMVSDNVEGMGFWGLGDTITEAMDDYGDTITEMYEFCEQDAADGDEWAIEQLAQIERYIGRGDNAKTNDDR